MCGFVLYDTQLIVEKRRRGDDDYIWLVALFLQTFYLTCDKNTGPGGTFCQ